MNKEINEIIVMLRFPSQVIFRVCVQQMWRTANQPAAAPDTCHPLWPKDRLDRRVWRSTAGLPLSFAIRGRPTQTVCTPIPLTPVPGGRWTWVRTSPSLTSPSTMWTVHVSLYLFSLLALFHLLALSNTDNKFRSDIIFEIKYMIHCFLAKGTKLILLSICVGYSLTVDWQNSKRRCLRKHPLSYWYPYVHTWNA